jgi:hypothetical protein
MPSIVIRIRQKGYVRSAGYQAVNWAVTVPVADPPSSPLIGTTPLSYAPLFVVRDSGGFDSLERVATLQDLVALPQAELRFLDVRGPGGDAAFAPAVVNGPLGPFAGDTLTFPDTAGRLSYWLEDSPPYNSNSFVVKQSAIRAQGTNPQILTGNRLQLPNYTFTQNDVNRWVYLSGFSTLAYNGFAQITAFLGNTATINKTTSSIETGTSWRFPYIEIDTGTNPLVEPRFFPTRERNLAWELRRGAALIASATSGGATMRDVEASLVRSLRYTNLASSNQAALDLMAAVRSGAYNLQAEGARNNTDFTVLITSTYGP